MANKKIRYSGLEDTKPWVQFDYKDVTYFYNPELDSFILKAVGAQEITDEQLISELRIEMEE